MACDFTFDIRTAVTARDPDHSDNKTATRPSQTLVALGPPASILSADTPVIAVDSSCVTYQTTATFSRMGVPLEPLRGPALGGMRAATTRPRAQQVRSPHEHGTPANPETARRRSVASKAQPGGRGLFHSRGGTHSTRRRRTLRRGPPARSSTCWSAVGITSGMKRESRQDC
jgi:hypothetical protein